jgi:hypothetical protein
LAVRVLVAAASRHDGTREIAEAIAAGLGRRAAELSSVPVWLFSSGPLGPPDHLIPPDESADTARVVALLRARGHPVFAGRLERSALGFAERAAVKARRWFRRYWTFGVGSGAHVLVHGLLDVVREDAESEGGPSQDEQIPPAR